MDNSKCFFTGHRAIPLNKRDAVYRTTDSACRHLIEQYGVTEFVAGGALGFDTLAAQTVIRLREIYPQIKLTLYLPCYDQTKNWRKSDIDTWCDIRNSSDSYKYTTEGYYSKGCMHKRNRAMADDCGYCIAYCTHAGGGTAYTLKYARSLGRKIILINS